MDVKTKNDSEKRKNFGVKFLLCFSLYGNGKKLFSTKKSAGTIGCINGIRFFSMAWVVLGHSFYSGTLIPWKNTFAIADVSTIRGQQDNSYMNLMVLLEYYIPWLI